MTDREFVNGAKMSMAVVDPNPIRGPIVVAHVQVGKAIPVHVAERRRQSPIPRRLGQWFSSLVQKCAVRPGDRGEASLAVIEIKRVGLAILHHLTVHHHEPFLQRRRNHQLSAQHLNIHLPTIPNVVRAVIAHV